MNNSAAPAPPAPGSPLAAPASGLAPAAPPPAPAAAPGDRAAAGADDEASLLSRAAAAPGDRAAAVEPIVYDLKIPDGFKLLAPIKEKFEAFAQGVKLAPEKAQQLIDLQIENQRLQEEQAVAELKSTWKDWEKETLASLGPTPERELAFAAKAMDMFGDKKLKELFDLTGIGYSAAMARFLIKVGKEISEDNPGGAPPAGGAPKEFGDLKSTYDH